MGSVLVAYGTGEGQTAKVADYVGGVLADRGHDATTVDVSASPDASSVAVAAFDAVLVGSPVYNRRHRPEVVAFVERNREALAARPAGFFQLSLAATVPFRWAEGGDRAFVDRFVEETGWQPDRVGTFAGAVNYTRYDRLTRLVFRLVSAVTTGDTDTSRDYEYTDWDEVERFAGEFADLVDAETRGGRVRSAAGTIGRRLTGFDRGEALAVALLGLGLAGAAYWLVVERGRRPEPADGRAREERAELS